MVDIFGTDLFRRLLKKGTQQSYFGAKLLSIGITQRTPERAGVMSSALCEEAMARTEQNPLNKKAEAPHAQAGGMPEFVPTDEQRD